MKSTRLDAPKSVLAVVTRIEAATFVAADLALVVIAAVPSPLSLYPRPDAKQYVVAAKAVSKLYVKSPVA